VIALARLVNSDRFIFAARLLIAVIVGILAASLNTHA
jgi:hypothetical protein